METGRISDMKNEVKIVYVNHASPNIYHGMSLYQALGEIRAYGREAFRSTGGITACLSDGTTLEVTTPVKEDGDGGFLTRTSELSIIRRCWDGLCTTLVCDYPW